MIRKYHNHALQTNPRHREEEPHNNYKTTGRQIKQSNRLSLSHQDDWQFAKLERTQSNAQQNMEQTQNSTMGNNQQQINNNRTTTLEGIMIKKGLNGSIMHVYDLYNVDYKEKKQNLGLQIRVGN